MIILQFDKTTRRFKSYIQTNSPDSIVVDSSICNIPVDETAFTTVYKDKYERLLLKDDESIEILSEKPSQFHYWNLELNQWVEDTEEKLRVMTDYARDYRLSLLQELDKFVLNPLRFATYSDEQKAELAQYRQDLLDVPQQTGFPLTVVFPEKPAFIQ